MRSNSTTRKTTSETAAPVTACGLNVLLLCCCKILIKLVRHRAHPTHWYSHSPRTPATRCVLRHLAQRAHRARCEAATSHFLAHPTP